MQRRTFLSASLGAAAGGSLHAQAAPKPNFVFLFTDDQRFDTIQSLWNSGIRTPNMDRLARRGVAFTHACIMGGTIPAVCAPSRAMLMTGQTLFHIHDSIIDPAKAPPARKRPFHTFPEVLRAAGYETHGIGKWHNGPALYNRSFSSGAAILFGGMSDHLKAPLHDYDPSGAYPKSAIRTNPQFSSEIFAGAAIDFLKRHQSGKPYLLYTAFTSPHDPRMAPAAYSAMYPAAKAPVPANFLPEHPFDNGELKVRDELLAPFPCTPEIIREHTAAYHAMITEVDAQIGRVLDAVEARPDAANTYIVFAADNGLAVGRHGLMGKQNLYDHSVRVPLIVAGPNIRGGRRSDTFCYLLDLCPTLCELAGIAIPPTVEGRSLMPALKNPNTRIRDSVFFAYRDIQRSVRTPEWKLIVYRVRGKETVQLFDMKRDPLESRNLAGANEPKVREMRELLTRHQRELDDPWPA